jgi:hypothetical protein
MVVKLAELRRRWGLRFVQAVEATLPFPARVSWQIHDQGRQTDSKKQALAPSNLWRSQSVYRSNFGMKVY